MLISVNIPDKKLGDNHLVTAVGFALQYVYITL